MGHGTGYKYAHDYPNHYVEQQYLPYELNGREFYRPTQNGYEVKIREHMSRIRREAGQLRSADLFLFMGQSNMAGRGKVCTKWPQTAPPLLPGAGYEFRAVSDPDKLYPIQEPFGVGENREDGINDVFTGNVPAKTGSLVTAFCNAYYEETRVPVIGVSASKGGSLLAQWQPDSPEGYLKDALWRYEKAWNWLKRQGYSVRHCYVLWCQGESDGDRGTTAGEYRRMFDRFLDELCAAGIEKCFLIRIGQCNLPQDKERYEYLIKLQEEIAATDDRVIMVSEAFATMRERGLMKDAFHYYQQGYNECGKEAGMRAGAYVSRHEEH